MAHFSKCSPSGLYANWPTEPSSANGSPTGLAQGPPAPGSHCRLPPVITNELLYSPDQYEKPSKKA